MFTTQPEKNRCQNQTFIMCQIRTRNHSHKTSLIFQLQDELIEMFRVSFSNFPKSFRINDLRIELNNMKYKSPNKNKAININ